MYDVGDVVVAGYPFPPLDAVNCKGVVTAIRPYDTYQVLFLRGLGKSLDLEITDAALRKATPQEKIVWIMDLTRDGGPYDLKTLVFLDRRHRGLKPPIGSQG